MIQLPKKNFHFEEVGFVSFHEIPYAPERDFLGLVMKQQEKQIFQMNITHAICGRQTNWLFTNHGQEFGQRTILAVDSTLNLTDLNLSLMSQFYCTGCF